MAGGINLYAYAGNNPVSFSDPFGLLDVQFADSAAKTAYTATKQSPEACANGVQCSTDQATVAKSALTTFAAAEADHSVLIILATGATGSSPVDDDPLATGGRRLTIDPTHAMVSGSDPSYTLSGLVTHEVTESYLRQKAGAGNFGSSYEWAHPAAVRYEDLALRIGGRPSRTSRSVFGVSCRPASFTGTVPYGGVPPTGCR